MKKLLLIATIGVAGLMSANNVEKKKLEVKKDEKNETKKVKSQTCYQYGMMAWCRPNEMVIDTLCYDTEVPGSYEQSKACMRENNQLYNIFKCGKTDYMGLTQTIY